MADVSDVSAALVQMCSSVVYPLGFGQPSIAGVDVKLFEGWPLPDDLDADMAAGKLQVSVFPMPGETDTSRYLVGNVSADDIATPTVTAVVGAQVITIGGSVPVGAPSQVVHLIVDGLAYAQPVAVGDTPESIAHALSLSMQANQPAAVLDGASIVLPGAARVGAARVAVQGTFTRETKRQRRNFQITVWAPRPEARSLVASAIDAELSDTSFLTLPHQRARLLYVQSPILDNAQSDGIYRRDLIYSVDFGTTKAAKSMTVGVFSITGEGAPTNL